MKKPTKEELISLYIDKGLSCQEIGKIYEEDRRAILYMLQCFGIPRRSNAQKGSHHCWGSKISKAMMGNNNSKKGIDHHFWKGESAGYTAKHNWARKYLGEPDFCEHCKRTDMGSYQWANISGNYLRKASDWLRLCPSCHKKYDNGKKEEGN